MSRYLLGNTLPFSTRKRHRLTIFLRQQVTLLLQAAVLHPKVPLSTTGARRRASGQYSSQQQPLQLQRPLNESPVAPRAYQRALATAVGALVDADRVKWSLVVDYVERYGGYRFGVTTCKKKFIAVLAEEAARANDERKVEDDEDQGEDVDDEEDEDAEE